MNESYLVVHVKDDGVGIVAQDLEKLFSRFGKIQRTEKINSEGIGLGLTIVKRIVEEHGGSITVFSEGEQKGSLFCFCIKCPVADSVLSAPLIIKQGGTDTSRNHENFRLTEDGEGCDRNSQCMQV